MGENWSAAGVSVHYFSMSDNNLQKSAIIPLKRWSILCNLLINTYIHTQTHKQKTTLIVKLKKIRLFILTSADMWMTP